MQNKNHGIDPVTRRQFLKDAGLLAGGALLGSTALLTSCGKSSTTTVTVPGPGGSTQTVTATVAGSTPPTVTITKQVETTTTKTTTAAGTTAPATTTPATTAPAKKTWGIYKYDAPAGHALVETDEMKCVGCLACAWACSMKHFGVMNRSLSRIDVRSIDLPMPKTIQTTCTACMDPAGSAPTKAGGANSARECVKICPTAAIKWDDKTQHLTINETTCLGSTCLLCVKACPGENVKFVAGYGGYGPATKAVPFVCDMCDTKNTGDNNPACVNACMFDALYWKDEDDRGRPAQHLMRKTPQQKADLIAQRLYPLKTSLYLKT